MYLYTDNNNTLISTAAKRVGTEETVLRSLLAIALRSLEL